MSGAVKSGLIFALVGLVTSVGFSFIPIGGPLWGIPVALVIGTIAGYYGVRWGSESAGVGTGVLAGAIAGVGSLIGAVISWIILLNMARSLPGFDQQMLEQIQRQQPGMEVTPELIETVFALTGPVMGICCGVVEIVLALGLGALGGWFATRRRVGRTDPPPPSEPFGPPPLSPSN
jgi:hypothetical protein